MAPEDWHLVIDISFHGTFNCTKAFYDDLGTVDNGRIITISSVIGKQGSVGQEKYPAAKGGLFGFTRSLALELAPSGTTANCIAPGFTWTEMVETIPDHIEDDLRSDIPLVADYIPCAGHALNWGRRNPVDPSGEVTEIPMAANGYGCCSRSAIVLVGCRPTTHSRMRGEHHDCHSQV